MSFALDYEKMLFLDAEELAEVGIKRTYDSMLDEFRRYASDPGRQRIKNLFPTYYNSHRNDWRISQRAALFCSCNRAAPEVRSCISCLS